MIENLELGAVIIASLIIARYVYRELRITAIKRLYLTPLQWYYGQVYAIAMSGIVLINLLILFLEQDTFKIDVAFVSILLILVAFIVGVTTAPQHKD